MFFTVYINTVINNHISISNFIFNQKIYFLLYFLLNNVQKKSNTSQSFPGTQIGYTWFMCKVSDQAFLRPLYISPFLHPVEIDISVIPSSVIKGAVRVAFRKREKRAYIKPVS